MQRDFAKAVAREVKGGGSSGGGGKGSAPPLPFLHTYRRCRAVAESVSEEQLRAWMELLARHGENVAATCGSPERTAEDRKSTPEAGRILAEQAKYERETAIPDPLCLADMDNILNQRFSQDVQNEYATGLLDKAACSQRALLWKGSFDSILSVGGEAGSVSPHSVASLSARWRSSPCR